jgi:MarR family transcriptional regulator for hemolysin
LTTLEERFSGALHNTSRAWKAAIDRRLKYLGMSQASWTTIGTIAKADAAMSQIELANKLGIEAATMVTMIDRLSKAGLMQREASPVDRRVKLIVLTEAGHELYAKVKREADILRTELLADIDENKLLAATELLEHLQRVTESS